MTSHEPSKRKFLGQTEFFFFSCFDIMSKQQPQYNTPDADDSPPPAYQETPPFNPHYTNGSSSQQQQYSSAAYTSPPFNPHYVAHSPPHTPDPTTPSAPNLYPQIPSQPQYQTIQIPYTVVTSRRVTERRGFPLAAIFFLFGW